MAVDDRHELALSDSGYPSSVRELADAPVRLYVRGDPAVLSGPCLSVVGARNATPYGEAVAEMAGRVAGESGVTVVSGGARGCDRAAGMAAMDAGGRHVVVLGCGADVAYPKSSQALIDRAISRGGAVVSLDPWGTPPRKWAFPRRNKVIAALSAALLVTEAGLPSGTFSTAEAAVALGRELIAVPGSILSPQSRGSNHLIANGACPICDEEDLELAISRVYGVLRLVGATAGAPAGDSPASRVMAALTASPLRVEGVASLLGVPALDALQVLSELCVAGMAERLLDGRFAPTKSALHARTALGHNVVT